jgi:hypothetical protein
VDVVLLGVLDEEDEPMPVLAPVLPVAAPVLPVPPVAEPEVPPAPMDVPEPVEPVLEPVVEPMLEPVPVLEPAAVSVELGVVVVLPVMPPLELPVVPALVEGEVGAVDGVVVVDDEDDVELSVAASRLPQALRDRAAIRARAAHCAIGDLIIRNSLRVSIRGIAGSVARCLRLTLRCRVFPDVVCHCRSM